MKTIGGIAYYKLKFSFFILFLNRYYIWGDIHFMRKINVERCQEHCHGMLGDNDNDWEV